MPAKARLRLDGSDPINRGLLSFWPLDDAAAGIARDLVPSRRILSTATSPGITASPLGRAKTFATNKYLQDASFIWPGGQNAAISVWINTAGGVTQSSWDFGNGRSLVSGNAFYCHLPYSDNNLYLYYGAVGSGELSTSFASYLNKWTHVAWSTSGNRKAIWINGRLAVSSGTVSAAVAAGTGAYLGYSPASLMYANGSMALFRLYTRPLSDVEAMRLYRDPWAGTGRGLRIAPSLVSPSVSVSLSGISSSFFAGSLRADHDVSTSGSAATFSAGTVTPGTTVSASGSAITSSSGTMSPGTAVSASGSAITSAAGSLAFALGLSLSGSSSTSALGTLSPGIGLTLSGADLTLSAGSVAYTAGFALTGVSAGSATGTISGDGDPYTDITRTLTGLQMRMSPGNVRVTGGTRWVPQAPRAVAIATSVGNTMPPPPRLTGNSEADVRALQQYLATLYDQFIKVNNVLGRINDHETRIAAIEADQT